MTKRSERPNEHGGIYYWPSRRGAEQAIDDMMIRRQYPHARIVEFTRGYAVQLYKSGPYIPLSGDERHTFAGEGDVLDNPGAKMPQAFTYNDAAEIYDNTPRGKLGANTTIRREPNGDFVIRLYDTDILTYHPDDTITINTGGYHTVTTKARINAFISPMAELYAKRGKWYLKSGSGVYPFEDGATLTTARGGVRKNPRARVDRMGFTEFPEDRFAFRGYLVQLGSDRQHWYISKDGQHIGSAVSADKAHEIIIDLTPDYRGER